MIGFIHIRKQTNIVCERFFITRVRERTHEIILSVL